MANLETSLGLKTQQELSSSLDQSIRERIHIEEIGRLYDAYQEMGIDSALNEILTTLPIEVREPLIHTLTTHVTKEKPVFAYAIGRSNGADKRASQLVAASVDLLWVLSLMADDLIDGDQQRAGKDTAWVKFGPEKTTQAALTSLQAIGKKLGRELNPQTAQLALAYINRGVASVEKQKLITLDSSMNQILANYEERADFHCRFPVEVLLTEPELDEFREKAILGLQLINQVGQILNDFKDLMPGGEFGRESYRDIQNGTVTIPVKMLWDSLDSGEKEEFSRLFGKKSLSGEEVNLINRLIENSTIKARLKRWVQDGYVRALSCFAEVVDENYFCWFELWAGYKIKQAEKILSA